MGLLRARKMVNGCVTNGECGRDAIQVRPPPPTLALILIEEI